MNTIFSEIK